jgi:hypothetical protein
MKTLLSSSRFSLTVTALLLTLTVSWNSQRPSDGAPAAVQATTARQKGMSYATWWPGAYSTPDADLALAQLAETGAEWISLIVTQ